MNIQDVIDSQIIIDEAIYKQNLRENVNSIVDSIMHNDKIHKAEELNRILKEYIKLKNKFNINEEFNNWIGEQAYKCARIMDNPQIKLQYDDEFNYLANSINILFCLHTEGLDIIENKKKRKILS